MRAWAALRESTGDMNLKAWLYTIVRNRALNARATARPERAPRRGGRRRAASRAEIVLNKDELDARRRRGQRAARGPAPGARAQRARGPHARADRGGDRRHAGRGAPADLPRAARRAPGRRRSDPAAAGPVLAEAGSPRAAAAGAGAAAGGGGALVAGGPGPRWRPRSPWSPRWARSPPAPGSRSERARLGRPRRRRPAARSQQAETRAAHQEARRRRVRLTDVVRRRRQLGARQLGRRSATTVAAIERPGSDDSGPSDSSGPGSGSGESRRFGLKPARRAPAHPAPGPPGRRARARRAPAVVRLRLVGSGRPVGLVRLRVLGLGLVELRLGLAELDPASGSSGLRLSRLRLLGLR